MPDVLFFDVLFFAAYQSAIFKEQKSYHFFLFSGHKELWGSSLCHSLVPYTVGDLLLCYLKEAVTNI